MQDGNLHHIRIHIIFEMPSSDEMWSPGLVQDGIMAEALISLFFCNPLIENRCRILERGLDLTITAW